MSTRSCRPGRGLLALALLLAVLGGLSSCSRRLGWGVVLWTAPEGPLPAGSVVPVYIRSNINKVYVVGSLDGKKKLELPFWQVELFPSKPKAKARVAEFGPAVSLYLIASRDGLPVREKPSNGARRIYRLHEGQSVKALAKVEGEVVKTGDEVLLGDWYYVLTDDGSRGYAFSNTMRLFDEATESAAAPALAQASGSPARADLLFSRSWRPEYFQEMLDDGRVDLDLFSARFGLFTDAVRRQVRIELPSVSQVFDYDSLSEEGGSLVFEGTPLRVRFEGERRLVADWSGRSAQALQPEAEEPGSAGPAADSGAEAPKPGADGRAVFTILSKELRDAVRDEELRRQKLLDAFLAFGEEWVYEPSGAEPPDPAAAQAPASSLVLSRSKRFSWTGVGALPSGYLPEDVAAALGEAPGLAFASPAETVAGAASQTGAAGSAGAAPPGESAKAATGEAAFRLFLAPSLSGEWSGAVSLRFDQGAGGWTDFLFRLRDGSLELEPAVGVSGLEVGSASSLPPLRFAPKRR
ncbi:MAG TPA: SH3 domain-containing protein [Spirochaetia bacterium]|nr:SH3 domain-containing protein [Spirochaetia bacterium]